MISILEQFIYSLLFIIYGMFIGIYLETADFIIKDSKLAKVINYLIQIIVCLLLSYCTIEFIYNVSDGYIPIYVFLFFGLGWLIYYKFIRKSYLKSLDGIGRFFKRFQINFLVIVFPAGLFLNVKRLVLKTFSKKKKKKQQENTLKIF